MIHIEKGCHRNSEIIFLKFDFNESLKSRIKSLPGAKYSQTNRAWYIAYNKSSWHNFLNLKLDYKIMSPQPLNTGSLKENTTSYIETSGTTTSPTHSDNAGIAADHTSQTATSVHPSHGDSKGTDIHFQKGGRSIVYNAEKFFISIYYNEEDVKFLKSLKGFWQSKIKKWILKASTLNLTQLQAKYQFWNEEQYDVLQTMILNAECPYLVTMYRSPENLENVIVQLSGHKVNIHIIKKIVDRHYQKNEKQWLIPNDKVIIEQLKAEFVRDGATVVSRLPDETFDYHKKGESYGQFKTRVLHKTETDLKPIVNQYLDTMIALKRSQNTITTYLGPFIKFVKHIGLENIDHANSKTIDQYMSSLMANKVSDGFIHNAFNAIMFYYRDVLRNNHLVLKEVRRPKKDDTLPSILSSGEIDRLLRSLDNLKHTTILYTFYSSGIRLNEILHLRLEDIWWDRDQIMVKGGKGKKDRVVPLARVLKEVLKLYFDEYKPIYWLFEGQDRKLPYSERSVQHVVKNAALKAKISKKISPHSIRHCFATHLLDGGTDVRYIQELLGHSDIKTTLIYTHVTNHQLSKIQSPLDQLMNAKQNVEINKKEIEKPESL